MEKNSISLLNGIRISLQEDEKILWKQIEIVNLNVFRVVTISISGVIIFILFSLFILINIGQTFALVTFYFAILIIGLIIILALSIIELESL